MDARRQCNARSKQSSERCRRAALIGDTKCRSHAGRSRAESQGRRDLALVQAKASKIIAREGGTYGLVHSPVEELLKLCGEAKVLKESLAALVSELDEVRYPGRHGEQVRGEIVLYERAVDRLAKLLTDAVRLDLEPRKQQILEARGDVIRQLVLAAMRLLGAEVDQDAAMSAIARAAADVRSTL